MRETTELIGVNASLDSGEQQGYPKPTSPPFTGSNGFDSSATGPGAGAGQGHSPVDSDLMTPLSIPLSTPTTPHTLQSMHWADAAAAAPQSNGYNSYFSSVQTDVYAKAVPYDVVA